MLFRPPLGYVRIDSEPPDVRDNIVVSETESSTSLQNPPPSHGTLLAVSPST